MGFIPDFNIGSIISNQKLYTTFKCGNMGVMRRYTRLKYLVLISDYTKDIYEYRWIDYELHYTGIGKIGYKKLSSQNKTLYYSKDNDIEIHLFEVLKPQQYTHIEAYLNYQTNHIGLFKRILLGKTAKFGFFR